MKVILAIDDSPYSQHVLTAVCKRKWPSDCQFKLLTVIEPTNMFVETKDKTMPEEIKEKRNNHASSFCEAARHKLMEHHPEAQVHYEIREGSPKKEIIDAACEWSSDKILIGAHGRDVCPHWLLGSVSRAVAAHAPCTVEIIRDKGS